MASVQIADIYDPVVFNGAVQEAAIELNRFRASGIIADDATISAMASGPGQTGELPFFLGLTNDEPNYSSDDPTAFSTPAKITDGLQTYMSAHKNKSWSTMDLARELALQDPLGAIVNRIAKYWAVDSEKRLINSLKGVMADNIANDSGDMVNAIHLETTVGVGAANLISADAVIDTAGTLGDHASAIDAIAMHSVVYQRLQKQNLITYIPNARGEVNIPTYLGYTVIVDDSLAPRAGTTSGLVYTTILFASGVIAGGMGSPKVPSELERKPSSGNGGGEDILYSRQTEIVHPFGFAFIPAGGGALSGKSPTYAELATAAKWNRVYGQRKNIGIAFLTTNG